MKNRVRPKNAIRSNRFESQMTVALIARQVKVAKNSATRFQTHCLAVQLYRYTRDVAVCLGEKSPWLSPTHAPVFTPLAEKLSDGGYSPTLIHLRPIPPSNQTIHRGSSQLEFHAHNRENNFLISYLQQRKKRWLVISSRKKTWWWQNRHDILSFF